MTGEMVVYSPIGCPALNVRLADETIWLTMQQLATVFGVDRSVIGKHIRNVYKTGELDREATWARIAQVQIEGGRRMSRIQKFYNLDAIISVGYRVNSIRGVKFRQWATRVLREYLLRGLVRDRRIGKLEKRMTAAERSIDTIIYTLMPALPANRKPIGFNP